MPAHDIINGYLIITQEKTTHPLRIIIRGGLAELLKRIAARKDSHRLVTAVLLTHVHANGGRRRCCATTLTMHAKKRRRQSHS